MIEIFFFDIPVYRISENIYCKEVDKYAEKIICSSSSPHLIESTKKYYTEHPKEKQEFRARIQNSYGGVWKYNEIIGYMQLYFLGSQIRGQYWQMQGKRIQRTRRKIFESRTSKLAPEIHIPLSASNEEIFTMILQYLADCNKELKNRYLDISHFKTIGPYINWQKLMLHHISQTQCQQSIACL